MFPIRDAIQSKNYPIVNTAIIGLNVVFYLVELAQGQDIGLFFFNFGLVPARYTVPQIAADFSLGQQVFSLFSFMFIHGGFLHLFGNMWSLYIFGDNVEDRLGHLRYVLFYLMCGWVSGLSHLVFNVSSRIPTIGASGAIAGVMGAYLILYPNSRILTLIPILIIPYFIEIPAFFFLGVWFLLQFMNVISATGGPAETSGIAWWAHIGGFIFGIIFLKLITRIPDLGITHRLHRLTSKRKTPRFQMLQAQGSKEGSHIYGSIRITPIEARFGTRKLVNIPLGLQRRLFRITIPPKVKNGTLLRLTGSGRWLHNSRKGDIYIRVLVGP